MNRIIALLILLSVLPLAAVAFADESVPGQKTAYETAAPAYDLGDDEAQTLREHRQCLSYGLTFSTHAYSDCRLRLEQERATQAARAEEEERSRWRSLLEVGNTLLMVAAVIIFL